MSEGGYQQDADPHFGTFYLPFVSVAFVSPPFCLKVVENTGERVVLAVLGWRRRNSGTLLGLLVGLGLLLLPLLLLVIRL